MQSGLVLKDVIVLLFVSVTYCFIVFQRNIFSVRSTQHLIHAGDHTLSLDTKLLAALTAGRRGY